MIDFEKFKKELLSKEKFYSSLINRKISDKEYEHVFNVWKKCEMKTMKDYHDLYLKRDVLLLAKVFEKFRNYSLMNYGPCPSHYLSAPGLSWDPELKMTKIEKLQEVELKKIQEVEFLVFLISNRYQEANNKYLISYDQNKNQNILYT